MYKCNFTLIENQKIITESRSRSPRRAFASCSNSCIMSFESRGAFAPNMRLTRLPLCGRTHLKLS